MRRFSRSVLFAAPFMLALGACSQSFNADVSRFQTQLPAPQGRTFAVVADDPRLSGGIEFSQYARLVAGEMNQLGYTEVSDPARADLVVRMDYEVDNGREKVRSSGFAGDAFAPWYGGFYSPYYRGFRGRGGFAYGYYDPFFFGSGVNVDSVTVYTSELDLKIDRRDTGERVFEGKAEAMSRSSRLQYLVPNLVEAMFTDFPGNSGETVRISIAPERTTVRRVD